LGGEGYRKKKTEIKIPSGGYLWGRGGFWSDFIIYFIIGLYGLGGVLSILI